MPGGTLAALRVHRFVQCGLQRPAYLRAHFAHHQPLHQSGALRQLGIEQLFDFMARVAVALVGDQAQ
jgi:hypothetical protein